DAVLVLDRLRHAAELDACVRGVDNGDVLDEDVIHVAFACVELERTMFPRRAWAVRRPAASLVIRLVEHLATRTEQGDVVERRCPLRRPVVLRTEGVNAELVVDEEARIGEYVFAGAVLPRVAIPTVRGKAVGAP